jgi:uncharacterized protein (DUF1810 family)
MLEPMTEPDLIRFLDAQAPIYPRVVEELTEGRKWTHWMWFIFPQIAGLGQSAVAQQFACDSRLRTDVAYHLPPRTVGIPAYEAQAEAIKLVCISQNFNDRRARAAHSD